MPPPQYSGVELTLEELISKARDGIKSVKAIVEIYVTKDNNPYHHNRASIIIKEGGSAHMKLYNFGMLTGDVIVKRREVYVLQGRINTRLKTFIRELYETVFWWEGVKGGVMNKKGNMYIIKTAKRELHIDSRTLLPVRQDLRINGDIFQIAYDMPVKNGDWWYPSSIEISVDRYRLSIKIERLFINPRLSDDVFKTSKRIVLQTSNQG
jgi:hypothetical protein